MGAQSSAFTTALDTAVGGIANGVDIIFLIWSVLIPNRTTMAATRPRTDRTTGLRVNLITFPLVRTGLATSCISWLAFRFEQQTPEAAGYFKLARASFGFGHFLRL